MSSIQNTEVYIPKDACVTTVPVHSLPGSITKKMAIHPVHTNRPATFISPVELREKGTSGKPRLLAPGQFFLPVVTSNLKAFRLLQKFLHSGENSPQFADVKSRVDSSLSKGKNSIVLFDGQIFLTMRKEKVRDWPPGAQSSVLPECEAPSLNSPVTTDGEISDIIEERRRERGTGGAEDHGKYAEERMGGEADDERDVPMECDAGGSAIINRRRSEGGSGGAEDLGKCAEEQMEGEAYEHDAVKDKSMEDDEENEPQTPMKDASTNIASANDISGHTKVKEESEAENELERGEASGVAVDETSVKAQISEVESSLANGYKTGVERQLNQSLTDETKSDMTSEERRVYETSVQSSAAKSYTGNDESSSDTFKHSEIVHVGDSQALGGENFCLMDIADKPNSVDAESCAKAQMSKVESSLVKAKCLTFPSVTDVEGDVAAQIGKVQSPSAKVKHFKRSAAVVDVEESQVNSDLKGPVNDLDFPSAKIEGCNSAVEIVDVDDDDIRVFHKSTDDANQIDTSSERAISVRISEGSPFEVKRHESDDIVEVDDDCDDLIIVESCAKAEISEVDSSFAKPESFKRRIKISPRVPDVTDVECCVVNSHASEVQGSSLECKSDDIVEADVDCDDLIIVKESCAKAHNSSNIESLLAKSDLEIAEVDDNQQTFHSSTDEPNRDVTDVKGHINEMSAKAKRVSFKSDGKIIEGDGRQVKGLIKGPISEIMSSSSTTKGWEKALEIVDVDDDNQVLHKSADDPESHTNARSSSVKRCESAVEIMDLDFDDEVFRRSTDDPNQDTTDVEGHINETSSDAKAKRVSFKSDVKIIEVDGRQVKGLIKGSISEIAGSSSRTKGWESALEIVDDRVLHKSTDDTNQVGKNSENRTNARISEGQSSSVKRCESAVEIVDLDDDDEVFLRCTDDPNQDTTDVEGHVTETSLAANANKASFKSDVEMIVKVDGRQTGGVGSCKRRIIDTNSDVAAVAQVEGSSAKRSKCTEDTNRHEDCTQSHISMPQSFSSEFKRREGAADPSSRVKNYNCDVEIVDLHDDNDDEIRKSTDDANQDVADVQSCANETKVLSLTAKLKAKLEERRNRGHDVSSSDRAEGCKHDVEILELQGRRVEGHVKAQIGEVKGSSAKRFKCADDTCHENSARTHISVESSIIISESCKTGDIVEMADNRDVINVESSEVESSSAKSHVEILELDNDDQVFRESANNQNRVATNAESCVKSHVGEVLSQSSLVKRCESDDDIMEASDDQALASENITDEPNPDVTNAESCVKSHVSEVQSAGEVMDTSDDRTLADKSFTDESNPDVTKTESCVKSHVGEVQSQSSSVKRCESDVEEAVVETANDRALADKNFTDETNPDVTNAESHVNVQISEVESSPANFENYENDIESRKFDPGSADEQSAASSQSAPGQEVGVLSRITPPQADQGFDYTALRREENINLIRERLRGMTEKLNTLINSHR